MASSCWMVSGSHVVACTCGNAKDVVRRLQHVHVVFFLCSWNNEQSISSLHCVSRKHFTGYDPSAYALNRNDVAFQRI